ncbi:hypothetical protein KIN20_017696 [Parelaphostrongylus tenuis]|uniref:Uncharacterized protein n=1 Tax=Parelaphostrongylus tenuis TaxID=148309 RepID=A0AAD5MI97_PARTN|nr:hypothetical protein KIN20_017696 [Parelaphostrongylus tenuis]
MNNQEINDCMRCAARVCLLGTCILIAIIYFAVNATNSRSTETWDENDDLTRHLLEGVDSVDPKFASVGTPSVSVAIVIIVSLVSVSLLITGIIVVAIMIDPNNNEDDESDIECDSPMRSHSTSDLIQDDEHNKTSQIYRSEEIIDEL